MRHFTSNDHVDIYLADMGKCVLQTNERLGRTDRPQRHDLIVKHLPLAVFLAKRYRGQGVDFEDLIQVINLAVISAVDDFIEGRGKLTNFVWARIRGALLKEVRTRRTCITKGEHVKAPSIVSIRLSMIPKQETRSFNPQELYVYLDRLQPQYANLLRHRLDGKLHTEIAAERGVSPQSVRDMEKKAIRDLFKLVGRQYNGETLCELGVVETRFIRNKA